MSAYLTVRAFFMLERGVPLSRGELLMNRVRSGLDAAGMDTASKQVFYKKALWDPSK